MRIGKEYKFEAAHLLEFHKGKCRNLHGHSYRVEVELEGNQQILPNSSSEGMVLDFAVLDKMMKPIIDRLDHQFLNDQMDVRTTAENVVAYIVGWLSNMLPQVIESEGQEVKISRVRLWETAKSYAEWSNA